MSKDIGTIRRAWSVETAAGGNFDPECPSRGQCAVTALVVQDWFGGELLRAMVGNESHYWNLIPGMGEIDLTREQYPRDRDILRGVVVPRSRLLEGERTVSAHTPERYEALKKAVARQILESW